MKKIKIFIILSLLSGCNLNDGQRSSADYWFDDPIARELAIHAEYGNIQEFILCLENPILVQIPMGVWHGFECIGKKEAIVINTTSLPYNRKKPDEYRIDPFKNDIPFKWKAKKGN